MSENRPDWIRGQEPFEQYSARLSGLINAAGHYLSQGDYAFNSGHEGYAIIRKHVDNLWTVVKNNDGSSLGAARIAMSVVAAVVCYMVHVSNDYWAEQPRAYTRDERVVHALAAIEAELLKARKKFPPFNTPEEGFAVLLEEFDELWDEVKANKDRSVDAYHEAKQVAAMALSFVLDCFDQRLAVQPNPGQVAAEAE